MTFSGRPVAAASKVIGIEDVFDARIASEDRPERRVHECLVGALLRRELGGDLRIHQAYS